MTIEPRARQAGGLTGFIREALGLEIECNVQDLWHWTADDWFLLQHRVAWRDRGRIGQLHLGLAASYKWQVVFIDGKGDCVHRRDVTDGVPSARLKHREGATYHL